MMEVPHLMISLTFPVAAFTGQTVYSNSLCLFAGPVRKVWLHLWKRKRQDNLTTIIYNIYIYYNKIFLFFREVSKNVLEKVKGLYLHEFLI